MKTGRWMAAMALTAALACGSAAAKGADTYVDGISLDGHFGFFYTGEAQVAPQGHGNIALGADYNSYGWGSAVDLPWASFNYGVAKDFEISGGLPFNFTSPDSGDGQSGLGVLSFGGKYLIPSDAVSFAVDLDLRTGPITKDLEGVRHTDINPKGVVTYKTDSKLVVNGELGLVITGKRGDWNPKDYIQLKGGVGYPLSPKVTGFGELGINQYWDDGTALAVGVRTGKKTRYQALLGLGLGDNAPDFALCGSVVFGL